MPSVLEQLVLVAALIVLAPISAALLRGARCPGWAVLGGVVVGLALGASVLGNVAPDLDERFRLGAVELREAHDTLLRRQAADRIATDAAGTSSEAISVMATRHAAERDALAVQLADAREQFTRPRRNVTNAFVFIVLLLGTIRHRTGHGQRPSAVATMSIGLWAAALPAGVVMASAALLCGMPMPAALAAGAAVAIGPWRLAPGDRDAASDAELGGIRLLEGAGRVATLVAICMLAVATVRGPGLNALLALWPCAGLALGWAWPARIRDPRWLHAIVLPVLAAGVAVNIDVFRPWVFWPFLLAIFASGDGRWLGAWFGAMLLGGRRGLRTMRLVLGSMAAGPTQLAVMAVMLPLMSMDASITLGLLAGAVLIEMTTNTRRAVADRLTATEATMDELDDS